MPSNRKPKKFSVKVYDRQHLRNLSARLRKVQTLIDKAAQQATRIAVRTGYTDTSKDFKFDDFPQARREIDTLLGQLAKALEINVQEANSEAWGVANAKNDAMVDYMLDTTGAKLDKRVTSRWYNHNTRALNAFNRRREDGMGLSHNVWRLDQFKGELELALELGLGRGKAAAELSRDVRSFLKYPDKLFRRVRDEKGNLRLSRAAEAFHPGQGVYRSSYKNALRLTATENNMAYRMADSRRWQQIDFVLGIEVRVSPTNHPITDICDELQGDYPKDFIFTGWHPFCKCFATPKLPPTDEFIKYQQAILDGEDVSKWDWNGKVEEMPDSFNTWAEENAPRMTNPDKLPYFVRNNMQYVKPYIGDTTNASEPVRVRTREEILQAAAVRHSKRTKADIRRIQDLADLRTYGQDYVDNVHEIEKQLGVKRGKRMTHKQANTGRVNPNWGQKGFDINCSTCSATYILRCMGFNVQAKANVAANKNVKALSSGFTTWQKWKQGMSYEPTAKWMNDKGYKLMNPKRYQEFLDEKTKEPGIYEFNVGYKGGGGHSTLLRRTKDGKLERIEQQVMRSTFTLDSLLKIVEGKPHQIRGIYRVDNAVFNPRFADIVEKVKRK